LFFVFVGNDIKQCRNANRKAPAGVNSNFCGMHLKL
jgi:hypothetical protein